ncbi:unnamed protein product [Calicophoron daubneyi]|uniref:Uncharacterized protein n=1 Tax=Calicophoron daubneyi TaxID=300641 RepID=A0AAV2TS60_CALDB
MSVLFQCGKKAAAIVRGEQTKCDSKTSQKESKIQSSPPPTYNVAWDLTIDGADYHLVFDKADSSLHLNNAPLKTKPITLDNLTTYFFYIAQHKAFFRVQTLDGNTQYSLQVDGKDVSQIQRQNSQ